MNITDFQHKNDVRGAVMYLYDATVTGNGYTGVYRRLVPSDLAAVASGVTVDVESVGISGGFVGITGVPTLILSDGALVGVTGTVTLANGVQVGISGIPEVNSSLVPQTSSNALSVYRNIDLGTGGANVKASAGQVYGYFISNNADWPQFVKFYDGAGVPVVGTDTPTMTLFIPASGAANLMGAFGIGFTGGIGIGATSGIADNNTVTPATNDIAVNIFYN